MLESAKRKLEGGKNVISRDDLDRLIKLSDKKIITYSEIIKRV